MGRVSLESSFLLQMRAMGYQKRRIFFTCTTKLRSLFATSLALILTVPMIVRRETILQTSDTSKLDPIPNKDGTKKHQ
jgi:hypothetical protein